MSSSWGLSLWAGPCGCNWPALWLRPWIPVDSYVVHFLEEALVRKRLGVGAEKFGISCGSLGTDCCWEQPWAIPGWSAWACLPFLKATQGSQGLTGCLGEGLHVEWVELDQQWKELDVLGAISCQQGRSFSLNSAVPSMVPGTGRVFNKCSFKYETWECPSNCISSLGSNPATLSFSFYKFDYSRDLT